MKRFEAFIMCLILGPIIFCLFYSWLIFNLENIYLCVF